MPFPRIGGAGVGLDLANLQLNEITLPSGGTWLLPAGIYQVVPGQYSQIQYRDPITNLFRGLPNNPNKMMTIASDGWNWRLSNLTGCAVGAFITNVGSGYTSAPVVTASAGGSTWTAVVGGAVGTVTVGTAGLGYNYPPIVTFSPPPAGGVQATGLAVLSSNTLGSVTVTNQGAGYAFAPTITITPDARDIASGAVTTAAKATCVLTGAGTITAVLCTNHGTAQTSLPTLTFTGGGGSSAAATVVMDWTITSAGFTVGTAGAAYGNAQPFLVQTAGGLVAGTAGAVVNPAIGPGLFTPRQATVIGTSTAGGAVTATGAIVLDGGRFQAIPNGFVTASGTGALPTTTAIVTMVVGGVTDTSLIQPI